MVQHTSWWAVSIVCNPYLPLQRFARRLDKTYCGVEWYNNSLVSHFPPHFGCWDTGRLAAWLQWKWVKCARGHSTGPGQACVGSRLCCHFQVEGFRPLLLIVRYTPIYKSIVSDILFFEYDLNNCTAMRRTQLWVWKAGNIRPQVKCNGL